MKKKNLEIFLQKVPDFENPHPSLEQYLTPAEIVADILFIAYQFDDIKDKNVLDLGCGTGIFSVGAYLLGAKRVVGIDIDENAINIAKKFANENNMKIEFFVKDVEDVDIDCDTVVMNPPFGAQKSNIRSDRKFIEKGFELGKVIYSIHLSKTMSFVEKLIKALDGKITFTKNYNFRMKSTFSFHKKRIKDFDVTLLRILTKIK